ncbi:MAG TPA: hypothetical protein VGG46_05870 [Terriglobales bacterium]
MNHYEPKFLIEWSSPWHEFRTAIRPALARSPRPLAGEAQTRLIPYRNLAVAWGIEALLVLAAIVLPSQLETLHPTAKKTANYDVIYFSGDELPHTEDAGGASAGRAGRAGGREAFHRTQTIRVARGSTVREQVVDAPDVKLPRSNMAVENLLAYHSAPGPPPAEGLQDSRSAPQLNQMAAVAPAPELNQQRTLRAPTLPMNVVAPAPTMPVQHALPFQLPGSNPLQAIPPPVSAPEQLTAHARLTLPSARPVAPAPMLTQELAPRGPGFGPMMQRQIVPPQVQTGNISSLRQPVTGLTGSTSVVPPQVQVGISSSSRKDAALGTNLRVVPPSPSLRAAGSLTHGQGRQGAGLGSPMDRGSFTAPPAVASSRSGAGVVVSSHPGPTVGVPGHGSPGALSMSPAGQAKPGIGKGAEGDAGISRGTGAASGLAGEGTGAGHNGAGQSTELSARNGNSPYPGTGGAGSGASRNPPMPGIAVEGGGSIVTLPSFGDDSGQPGLPNHSSTAQSDQGAEITIVATSRSGGAFNFYGALKGDKVYTIYIDTKLGTAVMQFADPTSVAHPYAQDLTAPQPMRADLPMGLPRARMVVACVLDQAGMIKNPHVLETGTAVMTARVLAALGNWKFRPALRAGQPIEVNAILGFNIDTSDRN